MTKTKRKTKDNKILIPIIQKNGVKSSRYVNKSNKKYYDYNRKKQLYIKKSDIEIKKIRWIAKSKKQEKKEAKKAKRKTKKRKEEIIEEKKKIKEHEIIKGHTTSLYEFSCMVSDSISNHCYAIRTELEDNVLLYHDNDYPDHRVLDYNLYKRRFIEDK